MKPFPYMNAWNCSATVQQPDQPQHGLNRTAAIGEEIRLYALDDRLAANRGGIGSRPSNTAHLRLLTVVG